MPVRVVVAAQRIAWAVGFVAPLMLPAFAAAQYEAAASYYASITNQTGTALKNQLQTIMAAGHVQTDYEQAGDYLTFTDSNPNNLSQLFLFYNRTVVTKAASKLGFTGAYNSREHVWPDSLQGAGDTTNATKGSRGDIHMLKPLDSDTNGDRGSLFFGGTSAMSSSTSTGNGKASSTLYFPGTADRGDAARIAFYAATRWQSGGSANLTLISANDNSSNNQMGNLNSLIRYHYQDAPDQFELRRNDVIYRGDDANTAGDDLSGWAGTNNRNAYIDRPEYAWSVFMDQANDTKLTLNAGTVNANGSSTQTVNLGRILKGAAVPAGQSVTLTKGGVDGTYYSVSTADGATSSVTGRYNAFAMDTSGLTRSLTVGLNTTTSAAGLKTGTVTIDNLDVTTGGGTGVGANDGNDVITVNLSVLESSNSSFSNAVDTNALTLDFGTVLQNASAGTRSFSIFDFALSTLGSDLTAKLDLDSITPGGNESKFATGLGTFTNLAADGVGKSYLATFDTSSTGTYTATYVLGFSDENLGASNLQTQSSLTLTLTGTVVLAPEPMALAGVALIGLASRRRRRQTV